ncbi:hypothetical protein AVEN_76577-1, partial [Araneus ventricosus]
NTNTTHFNNIITHIRHVSRDLSYYSGKQRRAEETEEHRKENTFWGKRNVYVSDNICKKNKSEVGISKLVIKRLDLKEYLHFLEKVSDNICLKKTEPGI